MSCAGRCDHLQSECEQDPPCNLDGMSGWNGSRVMWVPTPSQWRPVRAPEAEARLMAARDALCKARGDMRSPAETAWARMHEVARMLLVSLGTEREDARSASLLPWFSFAPEERDAMAAQARQIARDMAGAGALR